MIYNFSFPHKAFDFSSIIVKGRHHHMLNLLCLMFFAFEYTSICLLALLTSLFSLAIVRVLVSPFVLVGIFVYHTGI